MKRIEPLAAVVLNVIVAVNGTMSVVIALPSAFAVPVAMVAPLVSRKVTGKLPSKNHVPFAFPVIFRGLLMTALASGLVTVISITGGLTGGCGTAGFCAAGGAGLTGPTVGTQAQSKRGAANKETRRVE